MKSIKSLFDVHKINQTKQKKLEAEKVKGKKKKDSMYKIRSTFRSLCLITL